MNWDKWSNKSYLSPPRGQCTLCSQFMLINNTEQHTNKVMHRQTELNSFIYITLFKESMWSQYHDNSDIVIN